MKYEPYTKIDYFHNWDTLPFLLNSKPKDNVILCADIFCPCLWFSNNEYSSGILNLFFIEEKVKTISDKFKELFDIEITEHVKVPFSNQMICYRSLYEEYRRYLENIKAFEKISWLINTFSKKYFKKTDEYQTKYSLDRVHGYFAEAVTCFWFYKMRNDAFFLPNAQRRDSWYVKNNIENRIKKWSN